MIKTRRYLLGYDAYWDGKNLMDLHVNVFDPTSIEVVEELPCQDMIDGWWAARNEIALGLEPDDVTYPIIRCSG